VLRSKEARLAEKAISFILSIYLLNHSRTGESKIILRVNQIKWIQKHFLPVLNPLSKHLFYEKEHLVVFQT